MRGLCLGVCVSCVVRVVCFFDFQVFKMSSKIVDCCQFFGCPNKRSEGAKLFHFPAQGDERLEIWIRNPDKCHLIKFLRIRST